MAASDVAKLIVQYRADTGAPVDRLSLQKLIFYAQAFCLARNGEPLFQDRFKAWRLGPVIPGIWHDFPANGGGNLIIPDENEPIPRLNEESEACILDAVQFFSRMSPFILSEATHKEDPWLEARGDLDWRDNSDTLISVDSIRTYYAELISDGEEAFSRHEALDIIPEPRIGYYYQGGICFRKMTNHPLYRMDWAEALHTPVPDDEEEFPRTLFQPITRREFVRVTN